MPTGVPCQIEKLHYINFKQITKREKKKKGYSKCMSGNHDMRSRQKSSKIHLRIRKTIADYEMANKTIVQATEDPEFFCVLTSYNYGQRGSFNFFQLVSKLTGN